MATIWVTGVYLVEPVRIELTTFCLQSRRSTNWTMTPLEPLTGLEPATCALQVRCTTSCATEALAVRVRLELTHHFWPNRLAIYPLHQLEYLTIDTHLVFSRASGSLRLLPLAETLSLYTVGQHWRFRNLIPMVAEMGFEPMISNLWGWRDRPDFSTPQYIKQAVVYGLYDENTTKLSYPRMHLLIY